jgi:hypothetical protein
VIDLQEFKKSYNDLCIYELENFDEHIQIVEYAPTIFQEIRRQKGISEDYLFKSFAPVFNFQAIHNFFTGSGKSSSFFFFTDNKSFVLKTLKESEKKLLLESNVLENYYEYVKQNKKSYLSAYYGVYTIRIKNMSEITCFIMDNLLG